MPVTACRNSIELLFVSILLFLAYHLFMIASGLKLFRCCQVSGRGERLGFSFVLLPRSRSAKSARTSQAQAPAKPSLVLAMKIAVCIANDYTADAAFIILICINLV